MRISYNDSKGRTEVPTIQLKKRFWAGLVVLLILAAVGCRNNEDQEDPGLFTFGLDVPPSGATDVDPRILLRWSIWNDFHRVTDSELYFGTDPNPPFLKKITSKDFDSYRPGPLKLNQTYYWKVAIPSPACESKVGSFTVTRDRTIWNFYLGRGQSVYDVAGAPMVYGDKVYQMGTNGNYYCLEAASGKLLWTLPTNAFPVYGMKWGAMAAAGKVYLSANKLLYCLDALTGAVLWTAASPDPNYGWRDPLVLGDRLYCYINTGIYCLDAATGNKIWGFDRSMYTGICTENEKIFFGTKGQNDVLYMECLDAGTGSSLWKQDVGSTYIGSGPVVANGKLFLGNNHDLYCYNTQDGALNWKFASSDNVGIPFVFSGKVFVSPKNHHFMLLNASDGAVLWETETPQGYGWGYSNLNGAPVFVGNSLVFADVGGYVFCLDADSGSILWKYFVTPDMFGVALFGKQIFVAGDDEYLYCLNID